MSPQFVDFDGDSYTDIITATYEGTAFMVRGSAEGWREPGHLVDAQGRTIVLSLYYDMKENRYDNADRSPQGKTNPGDHCVSAMVFDWDNDGDFDLLLGAYEGRLYLQRNDGTAGEPKFTGENELLTAGGAEFNVPGGLTAPRAIDWDGDGLTDLVCGSFGGGVYLYRNTGRAGAPSFAAPVTLIASGQNGGPSSGVYADPVDYDEDGDLDLLVGGYSQYQPEQPDLSDAQKARIDELNTEIAKVQEVFNAVHAEAEKEVAAAKTAEERQVIYDKVNSREDIQAAQQNWQALYQELEALQPRAQRVAGVWLYRRE
jgi:hypothetical protein